MHTFAKLFLCGLFTLTLAAGGFCQQGLSTDPPKIIYVDYAAVLVTIDGPPVLRPIPGTNLARVINSPFFIVQDTSTSRDYLYGGGYWYSAPGVTSTNWKPISNPPAEVLRQQQLARKEAGAEQAEPGVEYDIPPSIIVSTEPAELISSTGEASYTRISGTRLAYMDNTDKDVLYDEDSGYTFVLLSGRWYKSKSLDGPWSYVRADRLPEDFSRIPSDHARGRVLASVAGTDEAEQALADAEIPQESVIRRDAEGPQVVYDGEPVFERIDGTSVYWANNTPYQVIRVDGRYYCVDEGVWYVANNPGGVWRVATYVPQEILRIPPSSPVYNVRYVYITRYTSDRVYCGYYPGYTGYYVHGPTVVWGTGHRYRGHYRRYACPRPYTWGYGAVFIIKTGCWSFGIGFSPDWFNCGYGWGHRFDNWFGPLGYRDYDPDYRYRKVHRIHTRFRDRDYNIYGWRDNDRRNAEPPRPRNRYRPPARDHGDDDYQRTPGGWRKGGRGNERLPDVKPGDKSGGRDRDQRDRVPVLKPGQERPGDRQGYKPGERGGGKNERLPGIPGTEGRNDRPRDDDEGYKPPKVDPGQGKPRNDRQPDPRYGGGNGGRNENGSDRWLPESGQGGTERGEKGDGVKHRLPEVGSGRPEQSPRPRDGGEYRPGGGYNGPPPAVDPRQPGQFPKPYDKDNGYNRERGENRRLPETGQPDNRRGGGWSWGQPDRPADRGRGGSNPNPSGGIGSRPNTGGGSTIGGSPKRQEQPKQQDRPKDKGRDQYRPKTEEKTK